MRLTMVHTIVLLLTVSLAAAAPQPPAGDGQEGPGRRGRAAREGLSPIEVVNMLDAYAVPQAQNALQLTDAQYGQFVTRLRRLHQTRRQALQERHRLLQQLRRLSNPQVAQADDNAIRTTIKELRDLEDRSSAEIRKAYDALDELLDARQQARLRVFEENLERRKLDLLLRAQQGAASAPRR
jgi:DNA repair ATPase RecN